MKRISVFKEGKELCEANMLKTSLEKAIGLMMRKGTVVLKYDTERKIPIHTFFCYSMLIAWISSEGEVLDVVSASPFKVYSSDVDAKYVFETTRKDIEVREGDEIYFK